jgi:hypothetical protein
VLSESTFKPKSPDLLVQYLDTQYKSVDAYETRLDIALVFLHFVSYYSSLTMADNNVESAPILSAVSGSARQLFVLLRCISFGSKFQVQPTEDGIRFSVEDSSVMEGGWRIPWIIFSDDLQNE